MSDTDTDNGSDSGSFPLIVSGREQARRRQATVSQATLLRWGTAELVSAGVPTVEARWLLEWSLGVDSLLRAPTQVGIRAAEKYRSAIAQRRAHVPLQHITGEMSFRGLTLSAGPGVFSVRPETEGLVDLALQELCPGPAKAADLCAGSGAIGLALASERADTEVWLVEMDPDAARYLARNVGCGVSLASGSSTQTRIEDATTSLEGMEGTLALVVSNPPYVGRADAPTQPEAQADPPVALFGGGEDGMVTPRGIVGRSYTLLADGGSLVMEHGYQQGPALVEHALSVGFKAARTELDWAGKPRFLVATK